MRVRMFDVMMLLMFVLGLVGALALNGCTPPAEQGTQWPPDISFDKAQVDGYVVLETPAGESRVDLSTGVVEGEAPDIKVTSWGVHVDTAVVVNQQHQTLDVTSTNDLVGEGWRHCLSGEVGVLGMLARGRWPLSPECGASGVEEIRYRP